MVRIISGKNKIRMTKNGKMDQLSAKYWATKVYFKVYLRIKTKTDHKIVRLS